MLDRKGFNQWAETYDREVVKIDEANRYPFAGYDLIVGSIFAEVMEKPRAKVLDIGFGTASLTSRLYEAGAEIYGMDFSDKMIEMAKAKMPLAQLYQGDMTDGLVDPLKKVKYDFIILTYAIHHLSDEAKVAFLSSLRKLLNEKGLILLGDVAFQNRSQLEACQKLHQAEWDEDEYYLVYDELKKHFALDFEAVTYCSGILRIPKQ